ncbi:MAG: D-alanyl-D-alanine carboxypeptidase [Bdellovibrionales bacterium]|nr:D-alanyl-D-alanine carboxypeptidase [Bdellovibrionales bacterium]
MKTLFAFLALLQLSISPLAHARSFGPDKDTYEDGPEFFQPFFESDNGILIENGDVIDATLKNKGTFAYLFTYIPHEGETQNLTTYRATQKIKPASTMKLFTGWMAYSTEAQPTDYLTHMLRVSDNNQAIATLKKMGGMEKLKTFYKEQNLPLTADNFSGIDAAGLSHSNKVTAKLEVDLLTQIYISGSYDAFKVMLAQPTETSTIKQEGRFKGFAYPLYAKTGTLKDTASLAGYVELNHGVMVFSIISNRIKVSLANARELIDAIVVKYAERAQSLRF